MLYRIFFKAGVLSVSRRSDRVRNEDLMMRDTDLAKMCNGYPCHGRVRRSTWGVKRLLVTATHSGWCECEV